VQGMVGMGGMVVQGGLQASLAAKMHKSDRLKRCLA